MRLVTFVCVCALAVGCGTEFLNGLGDAEQPPLDDETAERRPCNCERDADSCEGTGDALPSSIDICQTWSFRDTSSTTIFVEFAAEPVLSGLEPAIVGVQFDTDGDILDPEAVTRHIFTLTPEDAAALGEEQLDIGFEEHIYVQPFSNVDGSTTTEIASSLTIRCDDVRVSGPILGINFATDELPSAFSTAIYSYGVANEPDLATSVDLFVQSKNGRPDVRGDSFRSPDWDCIVREDG